MPAEDEERARCAARGASRTTIFSPSSAFAAQREHPQPALAARRSGPIRGGAARSRRRSTGRRARGSSPPRPRRTRSRTRSGGSGPRPRRAGRGRPRNAARSEQRAEDDEEEADEDDERRDHEPADEPRRDERLHLASRYAPVASRALADPPVSVVEVAGELRGELVPARRVGLAGRKDVHVDALGDRGQLADEPVAAGDLEARRGRRPAAASAPRAAGRSGRRGARRSRRRRARRRGRSGCCSRSRRR